MIRFYCVILFVLSSFVGQAQTLSHEIGVEIQAATVSTNGGTIGGAVKWALVEDETVAFGPSFRYQYLFSQNQYLGTESRAHLYGGGGFLHYRFLDWFFLGTEIEVLKNPYRTVKPQKEWKLTALLGGGVSHDFGAVRLNLGILYDVADAVSDPLTSNPSPLSSGYFMQVKNPNNPNVGKYIPLIYRVAFFFPLSR
ncbi:hypothetical protein [Brumimicrobium aurantiacum]|nr:hypothetical protein [Brumimicrobium aurantiacum]